MPGKCMCYLKLCHYQSRSCRIQWEGTNAGKWLFERLNRNAWSPVYAVNLVRLVYAVGFPLLPVLSLLAILLQRVSVPRGSGVLLQEIDVIVENRRALGESRPPEYRLRGLEDHMSTSAAAISRGNGHRDERRFSGRQHGFGQRQPSWRATTLNVFGAVWRRLPALFCQNYR